VLYESGRITEAEHLALKILDTRDDLDRTDRSQIHQLLAFCAMANDDEANAMRQFVEALRLNPGITADPITWSPKVRRVFGLAQEEVRKQIVQEIQLKQALEASTCRRAALKSLYFPGAGQRLKGHPNRGGIISALFIGSAAGLVYSQFKLPAARDRYLNATTSQSARTYWKTYRDYYHLSTVTGLAAGAIYLYAFTDALVSPPAAGKP
jgi:hypothetical protein